MMVIVMSAPLLAQGDSQDDDGSTSDQLLAEFEAHLRRLLMRPIISVPTTVPCCRKGSCSQVRLPQSPIAHRLRQAETDPTASGRHRAYRSSRGTGRDDRGLDSDFARIDPGIAGGRLAAACCEDPPSEACPPRDQDLLFRRQRCRSILGVERRL